MTNRKRRIILIHVKTIHYKTTIWEYDKQTVVFEMLSNSVTIRTRDEEEMRISADIYSKKLTEIQTVGMYNELGIYCL